MATAAGFSRTRLRAFGIAVAVMTAIAAVLLCDNASSAASPERTVVTIVDPVTSSGALASKYVVTRTIKGRCTSGSAFGGAGTFRCESHGGILSQCWRLGGAGISHRAACQPSVWQREVIEVRSSSELARPTRQRLVTRLPWGVELVTGKHCSLGTGIPLTFETHIVNYRCVPTNRGLLGFPNQKVEPWQFESASWSTATRTFSAAGTVSVRTAWVIRS